MSPQVPSGILGMMPGLKQDMWFGMRIGRVELQSKSLHIIGRDNGCEYRFY